MERGPRSPQTLSQSLAPTLRPGQAPGSHMGDAHGRRQDVMTLPGLTPSGGCPDVVEGATLPATQAGAGDFQTGTVSR